MIAFKAASLAALTALMVFGADSSSSPAWVVLRESAVSEKIETRQQAAVALGSIGATTEPVRLLEKLLKDADPDVRQTSAAVLGSMKSRHSIPALRNAMNDEDPGVSFFAVRSLWDMGDLSGREFLEEVLGKERPTSVGGVKGAVRTVKKDLRNPSRLALIGAKEAAGFVLGPFSIGVTAAEELLKDGGAASRALAAQLLVQHCNADSRDVLEKRLAAESSTGVKVTIARALGDCGDKASIPILDAYLSDSRDSLKLMAAASIVRLSTTSSKNTHAAH